MGFVVSKTPEGIRAPQLIGCILLSLSTSKFVVSSTKTGAQEKLSAWMEFAVQDGPKFEKLGFPGILRNPEEGLISWPAWQKNCQERLEKVAKK